MTENPIPGKVPKPIDLFFLLIAWSFLALAITGIGIEPVQVMTSFLIYTCFFTGVGWFFRGGIKTSRGGKPFLLKYFWEGGIADCLVECLLI